MTLPDKGIQLGLGLIGIGRDWGHVGSYVPDEQAVQIFLEYAFQLGITFFDTAVSYGYSEERLGKFLQSLRPAERNKLTIATKFGELWDFETQQASIDHSYDSLCASIDRSLGHLGTIDLLQLHKTSPTILRSPDFSRALEYAHRQGISHVGASISDVESGILACDDERLSAIQLPYNLLNTKLESVLDLAIPRGKFILINRPYNMGAYLYEAGKSTAASKRVEAYQWILRKSFHGAILTGTKSADHLFENWNAFQEASRIL